MSPKTGRPKKDNSKDARLQIRVDKETIEKLDTCASAQKTNRSEIVRQGIDLVFAATKEK